VAAEPEADAVIDEIDEILQILKSWAPKLLLPRPD
jgi:hypothetical protein